MAQDQSRMGAREQNVVRVPAPINLDIFCSHGEIIITCDQYGGLWYANLTEQPPVFRRIEIEDKPDEV